MTRAAHAAKPLPADLRAWLGELLLPGEIPIVEQRYGLTDPLFRPLMRRRTFREIGAATAQHGWRARWLFHRAAGKLRAEPARASGITRQITERLAATGNVVTAVELAGWRREKWLGGYQPWGALLLLAETAGSPTRRYDYFAALPAAELEKMEHRLLRALTPRTAPATVAELAPKLPARLAEVILDRHPDVDATRDGRFFLFPTGAGELLADAAQYNERVAPHSQRSARSIQRHAKHA